MWDVKGRSLLPEPSPPLRRRPGISPRAGAPCLLRFLSSATHISNANHFSVAFYFSKTCNIPLACHLRLEGETYRCICCASSPVGEISRGLPRRRRGVVPTGGMSPEPGMRSGPPPCRRKERGTPESESGVTGPRSGSAPARLWASDFASPGLGFCSCEMGVRCPVEV